MVCYNEDSPDHNDFRSLQYGMHNQNGRFYSRLKRQFTIGIFCSQHPFPFKRKQIKPRLTINTSQILIPVVIHLSLKISHTMYAYGPFLWIFVFQGLSSLKKSITPFISWGHLSSLTERCISNENFDGRYFSDLWQTREYKVHMKTQGFEKCYCFSVVTRNSTT